MRRSQTLPTNLAETIKNERSPVTLARIALKNKLLVVSTHPFYNEALTRAWIEDAIDRDSSVTITFRSSIPIEINSPDALETRDKTGDARLKIRDLESSRYPSRIYVVPNNGETIILDPQVLQGRNSGERAAYYMKYRQSQIKFLQECERLSLEPLFLIRSNMFTQTLNVFENSGLELADDRWIHSKSGEIWKWGQDALKDGLSGANGIMLTGMYRASCIKTTRDEINEEQGKGNLKNVPIFEPDALVI